MYYNLIGAGACLKTRVWQYIIMAKQKVPLAGAFAPIIIDTNDA